MRSTRNKAQKAQWQGEARADASALPTSPPEDADEELSNLRWAQNVSEGRVPEMMSQVSEKAHTQAR